MLAYTGLKKYLFSASIFCRRTFYPHGATEVEFPFSHIKRLQAAKIQRSTRTLSGATRFGSYVIVVAPISPPLLVADSTFFLRSFLRAMRGHLLRVGASLAVINDQNRRPGGKHDKDSLRPAGLDHRSFPLVRLAAQR